MCCYTMVEWLRPLGRMNFPVWSRMCIPTPPNSVKYRMDWVGVRCAAYWAWVNLGASGEWQGDEKASALRG
jgi:hypothetical protein